MGAAPAIVIISIWSIPRFPAKAFAHMIEAAGFRRVSFTPMTGGVVALHSGWKL
jgi:demethylmenaquinone methyltransferase/2-methoxy-6-polyprenyl-1,4-benzoquinol methylase